MGELGGAASAASDVGVGGYHDMALRAAQRSLLADPPEGADGRLQITVGSGPSSAVTAFTPRLGGLGLGMLGHQEAPPGGRTGLDRAPVSTEVRQLELGLGGAEIAGVPVGLAATAADGRPRRDRRQRARGWRRAGGFQLADRCRPMARTPL